MRKERRVPQPFRWKEKERFGRPWRQGKIILEIESTEGKLQEREGMGQKGRGEAARVGKEMVVY